MPRREVALLEASLILEDRLDLVGAARRFTRSTLRAWRLEALVEDATLVASELVANAVLHAHTAIVMTLISDRVAVRVQVHDGSTAMPVPRPCSQEALGGRGLHLVEALSTAWGTESRGVGKVVWADVGVTSPVPATLGTGGQELSRVG